MAQAADSAAVAGCSMPDRMTPLHFEERSYTFPVILGALLAAVGGVALYFYFQNPSMVFGTYGSVYEQLGVTELPVTFGKNPRAAQLLDQLRREPCDREAIVPLSQLMVDSGFPRSAAKSARSFGERCGHNEDLLETAFAALMRLGDFKGAIDVADEMIRVHPSSSRYRYLRATAQEALKNYGAALSDYISALHLFVDLSNVASSEFYRLSRMYDALGRPCDAITPLEMYLSYDVAKRQTTQISRVISEFANKGKCQASHAVGSDRILVGQSNVVDVMINGARGRMIVDTGASMVSITPSFAARARIVPDERNPITFQVVGGSSQLAPGYAQMVQVGKTSAASVPVAVSIGNDAAFGGNIDGLLGMTFLARFEVNLANGALELKPRSFK